MRSWTSNEERAYDSPHPSVAVRVEVKDDSGTYRDWTNIDGLGTNLVTGLRWGDSLGQSGQSGEMMFVWRRTEGDNMSPYVSSLRYSGYLDVVRDVRVSVKVVPPGAQLSAFSWLEVFTASIDDVDLSKPSGKVPLRDLVMSELFDGFVTSNKTYGADDGSEDLDAVAAAILSDYDKQSNTLEVPAASNFQVKKYVQQKMPLMRALQDLYFQIGWDVRVKWNASAGEFRVTAEEPDRGATTTTFSFPPGHVKEFASFSISAANIRNWVKVYYGDVAQLDEFGNELRTYAERLATTSPAHDPTGSVVGGSSIDRYKWRFMSLAQAAVSLVETEADAQALADYAIADLADPTFLGSVELAYFFWPVEINDYYEFEADGKRFDTNQKFAVTGYEHTIDFGNNTHKTKLSLQGKPSLAPSSWLLREGMPGVGQPVDDVAPDAPTVTLVPTPLGIGVDVNTAQIRDFDQVLFFVGPKSDFTPGVANLRQASRSRQFFYSMEGFKREWLKVQLRDRTGNISSTAGPFSLTAKKTDQQQQTRVLQAKTQLRWYADKTITGYGVAELDKYDSGEFLGDYNLATGRFSARSGGTYRITMSGKITTTMAEGTDYFLSVRRDPDVDDVELGRAIVTGSTFFLDVFAPLDADDEIELQVVDPGAGSFANLTFDKDYCTLKIELVGPQERSKPYPFVEADPVFLDNGPSGNYSTQVGECHTAFRLSNGEILFCSGAPGAANPAYLHRNEVDTNKARSITDVSSSTDYWFGDACETADREIILCTNKVDATSSYGLRKYDPGTLAQTAAAADLGSTIEPRCCCHADNVVTDNPAYVGTVEPSSVGKIRSYKTADLVGIGVSADLGGGVNDIAHMNPQENTGGLVVGILSSVTAPDIVALDASDVTATEIWRIQLDGLATAGTSDDASGLEVSPEEDVLYAIGGTTNPTLYAISATGDIVWSKDLGNFSELSDITGCLALDVHPRTGDIAVLAYYDNTVDGTKDLDCVVFDPDGNFRWAWRELGALDPADDPDWTSDTTGHQMAFATDGAIWVSSGGSADAKAKIIKPFAEIPSSPPGISANALVADFDPETLNLLDGAAVTDWSASKTRRAKTLADGAWRLENDTTAEQPVFRGKWEAATVESVDRVQTKFAAVEFDGTKRLIGNIESTILADGAICVLVCEPVDATGDYFSGYEDTGSAAAPLVELENASGRLSFRVNVDGSQDTHWDHASRAGLQVIGCRGASVSEAGIWLNNAQPNQTAAQAGTDATPDGDPRIRLGQAGSSSGDWFSGWVYRWIWVKPSAFSAARVASIVHWARQYYEIPELAVEVSATAGTPADLAGPTRYFNYGVGAAADTVDRMSAKYLSGECLIANRADQGVEHPLVSIPNDGTAANWSVSHASPVTTNVDKVAGIAINAAGTYAYIAIEGDGTSGPSAGQFGPMRIDLSNGSVDYFTISDTLGEGGRNNCLHMALDETNDRLYFVRAEAGDEVAQHVASTGAATAVTLDDSGLISSTLCCLVMSPDDDYVIAVGDGEYVAQWAVSGLSTDGERYDGYSAGRTNFDGTDTTLATSSIGSGDGGARAEPARDGSNTIWFVVGDSTANDPYLYQYDPDEATAANRIITEVDVSNDVNPAVGSSPQARDLAIDKDGKIYVLVRLDSITDDYDVVRYDADGTFDISFDAEGVTIMAHGTYGEATRIAVDEDYNVYVGSEDGYVIVYSQ